MRPLVLRPEAEADVEQAREWYDQRQIGLGARFLDAAAGALRKIEAFPEGPAYLLRKVRRVSVKEFPYGVFYISAGRSRGCPGRRA